ncbi:uncharacterized membrane protein YgaE (UPF0421/DUF939 family), partial [Clostridium beijerinckii]
MKVTECKEIASAIQRTAFSAQEAGTPLSNLITYITTVSEKTRKSAETIGESFKTIYARYSNIKLGNLDEDGKTINDTETAMNRIGIAIRNNKGQFKEFDTVLQEFMQKFKSGQLSQVDYLAGIQALAGTRQRETLMALMENMDTLNQHQKEVAQSAGSAKKMMDEAYNQSLDARIQDLKRAFEELYEKITNSEQLKWLVSEFTQLITVLSNVDGKTIAFTATIGGLVLVMSKLSALNKTLLAGEAVTGLSKFIGLASGMTKLETGATGVATAFGLLKGGIVSATQASIAFISSSLGLVIAGIAVAIGVAISAFTSYKEHQAQLEQQSKNLKDAIDGVNESLKNGDTKGASKQLDKAKEEQVQLQKLYETRKRLEGMSEDQFYGKMGGADKAQSIALVQHQIDELTNSIKENGLTVNEETGTIKEYVEAQEQVANAKTVDTIKEQTKAQLEDRMNLEEAQGEYNNFIGTVQGLYTEYQTLSDQESLSADQKTRLSEVCSELQSKFTDLNVSVDENGVAHINNTPLIEDNISYLTSEG